MKSLNLTVLLLSSALAMNATLITDPSSIPMPITNNLDQTGWTTANCDADCSHGSFQNWNLGGGVLLKAGIINQQQGVPQPSAYGYWIGDASYGGQNVRIGQDFSTVEIDFPEPVYAAGLYLQGANGPNDPEFEELYAFDKGNNLIGSFLPQAGAAGTSNPKGYWGGFQFDTEQLDHLQVYGARYGARIDDLTYATPMPEPGLFALTGIGLVGLAVWRKKLAAV
jgi:hypothetical protein